MSYLIKTGPSDGNNAFDLQRREEERREKELERHNEEEKKRKGEQAKKDDIILKERILNKKRILDSTKAEIRRLEKEVSEIDPKIRQLKEEVEKIKDASENDTLKINAEKGHLAEIKIRIDEKKREEEKVEKIIADLQKDYDFIEKSLKSKEYASKTNGNLTYKEKEEMKKEDEKSQLSSKISTLKQEAIQAERVIAELEKQTKNKI